MNDHRPLWPRDGTVYLNAMQESKDELALWELTQRGVGRSITVYSRKANEEDVDVEDSA